MYRAEIFLKSKYAHNFEYDIRYISYCVMKNHTYIKKISVKSVINLTIYLVWNVIMCSIQSKSLKIKWVKFMNNIWEQRTTICYEFNKQNSLLSLGNNIWLEQVSRLKIGLMWLKISTQYQLFRLGTRKLSHLPLS